MADATLKHDGRLYSHVPAVSLTEGEIHQLKDGRAAVAYTSITAGDPGESYVEGTFRIAKTASMVILEGGAVYWDHSANAAHYKKVNDRDFYVGTAAEDATTTSTNILVSLNNQCRWDIDIDRDGFLSVPVGTQGLNTMGVFRRGGAHTMIVAATNEAQKLDMLSIDGFATGANAIAEIVVTVPSDGAGTVVDVSLGLANATHATDADSITESIFLHLNANSTTIYAESDDGTTEVAATDTTLTYTEGAAVANRVTLWIDMRNPADVQIYVNATLVLGSTVFNVNAATGPWFLLAHVEKTSSTDTYELSVHSMRVRFAEQ